MWNSMQQYATEYATLLSHSHTTVHCMFKACVQITHITHIPVHHLTYIFSRPSPVISHHGSMVKHRHPNITWNRPTSDENEHFPHTHTHTHMQTQHIDNTFSSYTHAFQQAQILFVSLWNVFTTILTILSSCLEIPWSAVTHIHTNMYCEKEASCVCVCVI